MINVTLGVGYKTILAVIKLVEEAQESIQEPFLLLLLLPVPGLEREVTDVQPGEGEEAEESQTEEVAQQQGEEGAEQDQPGHEPGGVRGDDVQLRAEEPVL